MVAADTVAAVPISSVIEMRKFLLVADVAATLALEKVAP